MVVILQFLGIFANQPICPIPNVLYEVSWNVIALVCLTTLGLKHFAILSREEIEPKICNCCWTVDQ